VSRTVGVEPPISANRDDSPCGMAGCLGRVSQLDSQNGLELHKLAQRTGGGVRAPGNAPPETEKWGRALTRFHRLRANTLADTTPPGAPALTVRPGDARTAAMLRAGFTG
jgi:hypothetical protein